MKELCRKIRAILLALLVMVGLSIVSMLVISILGILTGVYLYTFTLVNFKEAFFAAGCGIGLVTVYKDMLDYLKD